MGDDREPPHRALNKLPAVRHLLHASIRLQYAEEDPLIIHSTVMSCWKIINDYGKRTSNSRVTDIEVLLKPDKKDEFWNSLFEVYNYFKHADRDAFENLIV